MEKMDIYNELLNLPSLAVTAIKIEKNQILVECCVKSEVTKNECPSCKRVCETVNQTTSRTLRDLDISGREVYLCVKTRQYMCKHCNRHFTEPLDIAEGHKSYTHRMSKLIHLLCKKQSYTEVGAIVNVSSKTVARIVLAECKKQSQQAIKYAQVRRLGIDEQSHRKGKQSYFCVLTDLDRGIVLDMLPDRKRETLSAHFKALGNDFCNQITDVSCDNWSAYISISNEFFPNANLILDRFHVTKYLNEPLDNYRKALKKTADTKDPIHNRLKWILCKQLRDLTDKEMDILIDATMKYPKLKDLYEKREEFHHILDSSTSKNEAATRLENWIQSLKQAGIIEFDKFINMIETKKAYIVNYVTDKLSNGITEGLNNLIRSVKRFSFGMSNFEHLRWRVLDISS